MGPRSTPRAFGDARTNDAVRAGDGTPVKTPRAMGRRDDDVGDENVTPTPRAGTLTPRASALLREQRSLASPLRAAISPERPASGVRSSVKAGESATKRDVRRLRELNAMLMKQLSAARTSCAEAESARENLGESVEREMARSKALQRAVEEKAEALRAAAKKAKTRGDENAREEVVRLRELNARLVKEVTIARNVVKARESEKEDLKEAVGKSEARASTLGAEIEHKQKSLERVQAALRSATERAADSLRTNAKVEKLAEANAVLMGELAALRESASSDAQALRAQIAMKSDALAAAEADLAAAEEELRSLGNAKADVDRLRSLNATLLQQIKSLRVKADEALDVSLALEGKERELAKVQSDLKSAEAAKVVAEDDVTKLRELNVVLLQQITELKENSESGAEELAAKQSELDAAQMALELVEEESARAHTDASKLRELNVIIMAQIKTLKKSSLEDRAAFKADMDAKSAELSRVQDEFEELQRSAKASESELEKARLNIAALNGEISTLKSIAQDNLATSAHLSGQIDEKKLELTDVKEALAAAEAKAAKLESVEFDVISLRELNSVLIAQVKTLRAVEKENEALATALRERSAELEKTQLALAAAERARATGEKVSEREIANLRELNTRIIQRMGEVKEEQQKKFQQLIDSKTLELTQAKAELSDATKKLAAGRRDGAALEKSFEKLRVMNSELLGSIKALESEIEEEKKSTIEMRKSISAAQVECDKLGERLITKDAELQSAWSALMAANANLKHALHDAAGMRALAEKRGEELEEANVNVDRLRELNKMMIERLHKAKKASLEAEALNAEFAAAKTQAEVSVRQEQAKVAALEQQLKEKDEAYAKTTEELRIEMEAGNSAAARRLEDLQLQTHNQIHSIERQLEYANLELQKVQQSEASLIEDQKRSAEEVESLVGAIAQIEIQAKKDVAELNKQIFSLQKEIISSDSNNKALTKKLKSSKAEIKVLEQQLEDAQKTSSQRWKDMVAASKELQDALSSNKIKDTIIETMRKELKDLTNTAEHFTRLAKENGDEAKDTSVELTRAKGQLVVKEKRIEHLTATLKETEAVRNELFNKVAHLERKGGVAEITIRAAAEHLHTANERVRSLEHQLKCERAEFERVKESLTQSLSAAERSMQANMALIVELESKYQKTLQALLIERHHNEEEREEMRKELSFVNEQLEHVSTDLEAMIERNNRGILLKIADSDVARLVFGAQPGAPVRVKALIRIGIFGGACAMVSHIVREIKAKRTAR